MIIEVKDRYLRKLIDLDKEKIINILDYYGAPIDEILEDSLRIEVNPNRPDLLSAEGIVRAIKGIVGKEKGIPKYNIENSNINNINNVKSRKFIAFSAVLNVNLDEDAIQNLMQFQEKLHISIGRNRKKYSIGLYDLDKIKLPVRYEEMKLEDIEFIPLNEKSPMTGKEILENTEKGQKYKNLAENGLVLMDSEDRIISMPPIINADFCKVTEKTKNIFIDSTGYDIGVNDVVSIVASNIAEIGEKILKMNPGPNFENKKLEVNERYLFKLLGYKVNIKELLEKMRLDYENNQVIIPPYRVDIKTMQDIVEELAIAYGYYNIEPKIPKMASFGRLLDETKQERVIRTLMIGAGFQEVMSFILTSPKMLNILNTEYKTVSNPVSIDYSALRPSIIPSLLDFLERNKKSEYPQKIFEIGIVIDKNDKETRKLSAVYAGKSSYVNLVSVLRELYTILDIPFKFEDKEPSNLFLNGRYAEDEFGFIGEINPDLLKNIGISVSAFELDLDKILKFKEVQIP